MPSALLLLVHRGRVEEALSGVSELEAGAGGGRVDVFELAVEAGFVSVMARRIGGAGLFDLDQEHVLVAVGVDFLHPLDVAGFLAFDPELVARTAPVGSLFRLQSVTERLGVHEGEHQHLARGDVLRDAGDEAVGAEFRLKRGAKLDLGRGGAGRK